MKRTAGLLLDGIALVSLAWVATPVVLIRPFGAQTPRGLAVSYALRLWSPLGTLLLLVGGLAAAGILWRRPASWKVRMLSGLAVMLLGGCAFLARQNHFEWMFRPLPRPEFVDAAMAKDVADDDLVLAVEVAGEGGAEARAYPVLAMAYHHVVNDVVAMEPIVATY